LHYVIGLSVTNCQTGTPLGTEQSESADDLLPEI
jgi:hypothetical protein